MTEVVGREITRQADGSETLTGVYTKQPDSVKITLHRLWRTLIRVTRVYPGEVRMIIPGRNTQQDVGLSPDALPRPVEPGDRLHARVNLDADFPEQLIFEDWEMS